MRRPEEIAELKADIIKAFQYEFGTTYDYEYLKEGMDEMHKEHVRTFLFKRLAHLPFDDFLALQSLMEEIKSGKTKKA